MKKDLRQKLLQQRASISADACLEMNKRLCDHLVEYVSKQAFTKIFAFTSHRNEPDLTDLWSRIPAHITIALPRVTQPGVMTFHAYKVGDALTANRHGILEPDSKQPTVHVDAQTLVLAPCIAMSRTGARLGYGGGFYDRFLQQNQPQQVLGVAFSSFVLDHLPQDTWDQSLQGWVSELGIFHVSSTRDKNTPHKHP